MKLNFKIFKEVAQGSYPDVVHFANTQAQAFSIVNGKLRGNITSPIDYGEFENAEFEKLVDISPDIEMTNFELKVVPGWAAIGSYRSGNSHRLLIYEFYAQSHRDYVEYQGVIEVRDMDGVLQAYLTAQADKVKDPYIDIRLNGESTLEFLIPPASEKLGYITPECELWADDKVFILRKDEATETVRDERNRLWTKISAVERWKELETSFVEPSISNDPTAKPPADLAVIIVGGGTNLSGGKYAVGTAAHALYAVLDGSDWKLGVCDVGGIKDLEAEKVSRLELIKMIQDIWGGYLTWDSVNKIVNLRDGHKWQPYTGFQIRYRKNLKHISRMQSNRLVTKLYVFGHDDLDIAAVNSNRKYITNYSYTDREYVGIYKNQDIYYQDELLEKGTAELELNCRPRYLYRVKTLDLRILPEYSHEDFYLGDMVDVVDPDVAPDSPRPRIIRHKYNLFRPWNCELDIGDPDERLIEQLKAAFNTTGFIDTKFNGYGEFSGHSLEDLTVKTAKIDNLAVTTAKIDDLSVTTAKIENAAITTVKIENAAITTAKIEDLAVTNAKIESIEADKITAGTIDVTIELTSAKITSSSTITGVAIRTADPPNRRTELTADGLTSYSSGTTKHGFSLDSYGALNLFNSGTMVGSMVYDTSGAGTVEEAKNRMFITTLNNYALKIESSADMSIEAGTIYFLGDIRLPHSSSWGYTYIGNKKINVYIEDIIDAYLG